MEPTAKMDPPSTAPNNGRAPSAVPGVAGATAASAGADVSAPADSTADNSNQRIEEAEDGQVSSRRQRYSRDVTPSGEYWA